MLHNIKNHPFYGCTFSSSYYCAPAVTNTKADRFKVQVKLHEFPMVKQLFPQRLSFSLSHHEFLRQQMCSFHHVVTCIATKISGTVFKDRHFSLCGCFLNLKFDLSTIKSIYSWQNHVLLNLI